jgi:hypothetical protein
VLLAITGMKWRGVWEYSSPLTGMILCPTLLAFGGLDSLRPLAIIHEYLRIRYPYSFNVDDNAITEKWRGVWEYSSPLIGMILCPTLLAFGGLASLRPLAISRRTQWPKLI